MYKRQASNKALDDLLRDRATIKNNTNSNKCAIAVVRLAQSEQIDDEQLAEIEKKMLEVEPVDVSILAYFIGKELLIRGKEDKAKVWLKRSMLTRAPEHYYSSLAGMELARLNGGTTRANNDVQSRKDTWPPESP